VLVLSIVLAIALLASLVALALTRREATGLREECERLRAELERERRGTPASRRRSRAVKAVGAVMATAVESATRLRTQGVTGLLTSSIDDFARWAMEDRTEIDRFTAPDGTVAILFSDIEDSTTLNEQLGDHAWVALLAAHDRVVRQCVERQHGHIVKSQGDGFMIVFADPAAAVRAGIEVQDGIGSGSHRRLRRTPIRVRVGIHAGVVIEKDGDFFGTNVAMAARVAAQARGGQILVSDSVRESLRDVPDVVLVDVREVALKGLPGTHRLYEVGVI
jgi:adenylate cyclase